jgi:nucleoid-associated protein YgaU
MSELKAAGAKGVAAWIWVAGAAVAAAGVGGVAYVVSRPDVPVQAAPAAAAPAEAPKTDAGAAPDSAKAAAPAPAASDDTAQSEPAKTETAKTEAAKTETEAATSAQPDATQTDTTQADAAPAAPPAPAPPAFDTVRAETDGTVLIAGRAEAGQTVAILSEGVAVGSAVADASGRFAAFLTLPPSTAPRTLSLVSKGADGQEVASDQTVILQPTAPEVAVADAGQAAGAAATQPTAANTAAATASDSAETATPAPAAVESPAAQPAVTEPAAAAAATTQPEASQAQTTQTETTQTETTEAAPAETTTSTAAAAPKPADVLVADQTGVRKLSPGATETVVIDTISYSATGDVVLEGRGVASGTGQVLLYLDNAATGSAPIAEDGKWRAVIAGIAPGLYTLRADEVDATGKVTSRFETPFQREAPEVIAQAAPQPAPPATDTAATDAAGTQPAATAGQTATTGSTVSAGAADATGAAATGNATADTVAAAAAQPSAAAPAPVTAAAPVPAPATQAAPATSAPAVPAPPKATIVTVQPGFTLWRIARENYGDGVLYVRVFEANKDQIRNPDLIYPGQVFTVPPATSQP